MVQGHLIKDFTNGITQNINLDTDKIFRIKIPKN